MKSVKFGFLHAALALYFLSAFEPYILADEKSTFREDEVDLIHSLAAGRCYLVDLEFPLPGSGGTYLKRTCTISIDADAGTISIFQRQGRVDRDDGDAASFVSLEYEATSVANLSDLIEVPAIGYKSLSLHCRDDASCIRTDGWSTGSETPSFESPSPHPFVNERAYVLSLNLDIEREEEIQLARAFARLISADGSDREFCNALRVCSD